MKIYSLDTGSIIAEKYWIEMDIQMNFTQIWIIVFMEMWIQGVICIAALIHTHKIPVALSDLCGHHSSRSSCSNFDGIQY
jgi:hypothetical protein